MSWYFGPFELDVDNACLWREGQRVAVRPKTFDVLSYLVVHAGQLISKDELLASVWPEMAVGDGTLKSCIGELRKLFGETVQAPQFIATEPRRGYRFIAAVTMQPPATAAEARPQAAAGRVGKGSPPLPQPVWPPQPTRFVGRAGERVDILKRLADPACRLLTLTGPGGIGKTRLAMQTAQTLAEAHAYDDGVYVIPLAAVSATSHLVYAMAEGMGLECRGTTSARQQLLAHLQPRHLLLVLDNFEHLSAEVEVLTDLLDAAPGVTLLVTSREALNTREEWLYPVGGMAVPQSDVSSAHQIIACDAVRLFDQCARRIQPAFALVDAQAHVARICRLVEGMPLAIELAAAWLNVLSPERLAYELERTLDILTSRHRNIPERHRSMRGVLAHSWTLLAEADREVLQCLSLFRGGFRLEAAETIAGATLGTMANLVATSWLRVEPGGRYHLHELLRQFAHEHLGAEAERSACQRHSAY